MTIYFVGDIQGCYSELSLLLNQINFRKTKDQLWVAGDMVARGTESLETIRFLMSLGQSAKVVLGNHDLHLLATYYNIKKVKEKDHLTALLNAPDIEKMIDWIASQPLIQKLPNENVYMSHAGLTPQWSIKTATKQAEKAHQLIRSKDRKKWLSQMYGERPNNWKEATSDIDKFRFTINALTRMRFCHPDGTLDFECKNTPENAPAHLTPWYNFKNHLHDVEWIFGHWAALMGECSNKNAYALDTGCVWGNHLTLLRWPDKTIFIQNSLK